jgi:hypothetical protein
MSTLVANTGNDIHPKVGENNTTHNLDDGHPARADVGVDEERTPEMIKESTVWDVYNNEARKADNELVKDWTSLNFLLFGLSPPDSINTRILWNGFNVLRIVPLAYSKALRAVLTSTALVGTAYRDIRTY